MKKNNMKKKSIRRIFKEISKNVQRGTMDEKQIMEILKENGFYGKYVFQIRFILRNPNIKNRTLRRLGNAAKKQGKLVLLSSFIKLFRKASLKGEEPDYRQVIFVTPEKTTFLIKTTSVLCQKTWDGDRYNLTFFKKGETVRGSAEERSLFELNELDFDEEISEEYFNKLKSEEGFKPCSSKVRRKNVKGN